MNWTEFTMHMLQHVPVSRECQRGCGCVVLLMMMAEENDGPICGGGKRDKRYRVEGVGSGGEERKLRKKYQDKYIRLKLERVSVVIPES